jgi:hypothetical protein
MPGRHSGQPLKSTTAVALNVANDEKSHEVSDLATKKHLSAVYDSTSEAL